MPEHEAARLQDIPEAGLHAVEIDGTRILISRTADGLRAVGATCPHAGGPLNEGVRDGDTVRCPWHKAEFCLRSGNILQPPAMDPLPSYDLRVDGDSVFITLPAREQQAAQPAPDGRTFVIIGAGAAGANAAQHLRTLGFGGRVLMLDRFNRVPYDRTVLSKYHLSGEKGGEKSPLQTEDFYRQQKIERRTAQVIGLDPEARRISCADGSTIEYDAALIATGADPRRPKLPGIDLGNVFLLRSRADGDAIQAQAERSERAVVLGASFIGMEVAASLRERGLHVTVVGAEQAPFDKQLGAVVGNAFRRLHENHGVEFRLNSRIATLAGGPNVRGVVLDNGDYISADMVVVGFGVAPATEWLTTVPKHKDGSINVDAHLRAAPGLYVAGDSARYPLYGDGAPIRVEHWRVAEQHGRVAAQAMLGQQVHYDQVPVFWTIQYLKRLDYVGHASEWDDIVVHGDLEKPCFLAYYVKDGRVLAAAGLDRDKDTAALITLFNRRHDWTAEELGGEPARLLG